MRYTLIDHTADFGIHVFGDSETQLFRHAALAMFQQIVAKENSGECVETVVSAEGNDRQELMVDWLRELLYLWNGKGKIVQAIRAVTLTPRTIEARVALETFDPGRHQALNEIKAVTYHGIDVSQSRDHWEARIIFDV